MINLPILLLLLVSSASIPHTNAAAIDSPMESGLAVAKTLLNAMNDAVLGKHIDQFLSYQAHNYRFEFCYKSGDKVEMEDYLKKSSYLKQVMESTHTVIEPIRMLNKDGTGQVFEFDYEGSMSLFSKKVDKTKGKMRFLLEDDYFRLLWWQKDCPANRLY